MKPSVVFVLLAMMGCGRPENVAREESLIATIEEGESEVAGLMPSFSIVDPGEDTPPRFDSPPCICEWEVYFTGGLVCVGIICSEVCDDAASACAEQTSACQPL